MTAVLKKRESRPDANLASSQFFAQLMHAYRECSDEVQSAIDEMVDIVNDADATEEDKNAALSTIAEALFPSHHNDILGIDLEECERTAPPEIRAVLDAMDQQEATFGDRVNALLDAKSMTQAELGIAIGVGQSAISMMLSRECRPQRRTVENIASALEVDASDLWPDIEAE